MFAMVLALSPTQDLKFFGSGAEGQEGPFSRTLRGLAVARLQIAGVVEYIHKHYICCAPWPDCLHDMRKRKSICRKLDCHEDVCKGQRAAVIGAILWLLAIRETAATAIALEWPAYLLQKS